MRSCAWIFLCSGVLFTFIAWSANSDLNELNARRKSSTLANLRRHKPDPSDDWRIEEFVVCPKFMRLANADFDFGDEYWIPIYPGVDGEPPPKDEEIREILYLIGVNSRDEFFELTGGETIDVKIRTTVTDDDKEAFAYLRNHHYPNLKWDQCRVYMAGHLQPTSGTVLTAVVMAALSYLIWFALVAGDFIMAYTARQRICARKMTAEDVGI